MTTIVTRQGKGSALTYEEMDQNLTNIKTDVESSQANVTAANAAIASTASTVATHTTQINDLQGNAAGQQTTINTHTGQIATLDANLGTATTNITNLQGNAATQQSTINTHTTDISNLWSNAATQSTAIATATTNITNLQGNAGTQQTTINTHTTQIATLDANLGTATTNISNLWSNAATQSTAIAGKTDTAYVDTAVSTAINNLINSAPGTLDTLGEISANLAQNADTTAAIINSLTSTNANVTAANAKIVAIETVNTTQSTEISNLWSNAATQTSAIATHTTQISDLQGNAASQQSSIDHMPTLYAYVHNAEGATISKGQPVYLYQATGDKPSVKLAYNTGDTTSAKTLGLAAENLTTGADGWVLVQGQLTGINTAAYAEGDTLYLGATAGTLTTTKPYAPNHLVYIGVVAKANAGAGAIYVRIQNGYELDEIHDVQILSGSQATNDVLMYDATAGVWKNKTIGNLKANLSLSTVATTGAYSDLSGTPSLATVATSGSYADLTNKPTIPGQDAATSNQVVYKNGSNVATGSSSLTFDGTALSSPNFVATNSQADEGGEIRFALPSSGSTLNTSVTMDIYQNKLRIFETGGSARGAYIDLTAAGAGVGSNLLAGGGGGSDYGNTQVAAYLPTYTGSLAGSSSIVDLYANAAGKTTEISNLWSNAASQATSIAGKADSSSLATVATSGSYNDLSNKPTIPSASVSIDGDATGAGTTGSNISVTLANSGVTAGTYGDATVVPKIVVDAKGRVTSVSNVTITGGGSYGNTQVAAYLPTYTGVLQATSITSPSIDNLDITAGLGGDVNITAGSGEGDVNITTDNGAIVLDTTPGLSTYSIDLKSDVLINVLAPNVFTTGKYVSSTGYFWANGVAYSTGSGSTYSDSNVAAYLSANPPAGTYTNSNVAAYLPSYTGDVGNSTTKAGSGFFTALGSSGTPVPNAYVTTATATQVTAGNITSTNGFFWANGTPYSTAPGGGSGYGNVEVAAYLPTYSGTLKATKLTSDSLDALDVEAGLGADLNLKSGAGGGSIYVTAPYGAITLDTRPGASDYSIDLYSDSLINLVAPTTDVQGLQSSVNNRIFANAYPVSKPDNTIPGNSFSAYVRYKPVYTNGQVQQPPLANATVDGTTIVSTSGQILALSQGANIALQSGYGYGSQNRNTVGSNFLTTVTPVTANTMSNNDRVRGVVGSLDVNLGGKTWGTMSTASQTATTLAGINGVVNIMGAGSVSTAVGGAYGTFFYPGPGNTANVQYSTSIMAFQALQSLGNTTGKANVVYARMLAPTFSGFSSNLRIQNAVGIHTPSGWAGTVGTATGADRAYALLNEDSSTAIQTVGNLTVGNVSASSVSSIQSATVTIGSSTGTVNLQGNVNYGGRSILTPVGYSASTAPTVDFNTIIGGFADIYLDGNMTAQFNASPAPNVYHLRGRFVQDATGGRTMTWPGGSRIGGTLNTTANSVTMFEVFQVSGAAHILYTQVS